MEKYDYFILSCCILLSSLLFAAVLHIYRWLRLRFSVTVNCWFCQSTHTVNYKCRNSWDCPSCEQYNGFDQNGDYNCDIQSQYDSTRNPNNQYCQVRDLKETKNGLCSSCNRNQVLKIKQLALFQPQNEECFDEEIDDYHQYLESVYQLCGSCEVQVQKKLTNINRAVRKDVLDWRLSKKNYFLQSQKAHSTKRKLFWKIFATILRWFSLVFSVILLSQSICRQNIIIIGELVDVHSYQFLNIFDKFEFYLPIAGFFIVTFAIFLSGMENLQLIDAASSFSWLLLVFTDLLFIITSLSSHMIHDYLLIFLSCLASFISVFAIFKSRTVKSQPSSTERNFLLPSANGKNIQPNCNGGIKKASSSKSVCDSDEWCQLQDSRISTTSSQSCKSREVGAFNLNSDLSTMSIGTPKKLGGYESVFTMKSYGNCGSPFKISSSSLPVRRSILSPPRLHSATSFYSPWGSGANLNMTQPFIYGQFQCAYYKPFSSSFSCPVSRCGSVSGDDRTSIFSEPVWNSFAKPELRSFRRSSESCSTSSYSSRNSSYSSQSEDINQFSTSTPVALTKTDFQNSTLAKGSSNRTTLVLWLVLALSLVANATVFIRYGLNLSLISVLNTWKPF